MIFFIDENLDGPLFTNILIDAGLDIKKHRDHFEAGTPDVDWIQEVASKGWIAVTGDEKTRENYQEIAMIVRTNARVLHIKNGKNATHKMLAENFVQTIKKIEKFIEKNDPPCMATITRPNDSGKAGNVNSRQDKINKIIEKMNQESDPTQE